MAAGVEFVLATSNVVARRSRTCGVNRTRSLPAVSTHNLIARSCSCGDFWWFIAFVESGACSKSPDGHPLSVHLSDNGRARTSPLDTSARIPSMPFACSDWECESSNRHTRKARGKAHKSPTRRADPVDTTCHNPRKPMFSGSFFLGLPVVIEHSHIETGNILAFKSGSSSAR